MRTPLRPPRASLESTRGGSRRTPEQDRPPAGISRPRTGESRNHSQRQRMTDLTNPANESMILSSAHQSSHWADHGTCPIPAEPTHAREKNRPFPQDMKVRNNQIEINSYWAACTDVQYLWPQSPRRFAGVPTNPRTATRTQMAPPFGVRAKLKTPLAGLDPAPVGVEKPPGVVRPGCSLRGRTWAPPLRRDQYFHCCRQQRSNDPWRAPARTVAARSQPHPSKPEVCQMGE